MATVELHAMRRLSSPGTWFYKRVFPVCWLGFVLLFAAITGTGVVRGDRVAIPLLVFPLVMGAVGFLIWKLLLAKNVDEVWDAGDALLVRDAADEALIPLADIRNIGWSQWQNPETVTLMLSTPSRFGDEVTFMLPSRWKVSFGRHPLVTELIDRVDRARRDGKS